MTVFFITRFSIFDPSFRGFRLSADHEETEYEKQLFSTARLRSKFETFERITVPSILSQTNAEWRWLIFTSDRLPEEYRRRLHEAVGRHPQVTVCSVTGLREFFERTEAYNYGQSFATVRIDDDDGLSPEFVEALNGYASEVGSIVNFTEGALVRCERGQVNIGRQVSERNNAQGLAGININIYASGRHSDIDQRYRVIYDSRPRMYLLCCSPHTDTQRAFTPFGRVISKANRLLSLSVRRPSQAWRELSESVRKRIGVAE